MLNKYKGREFELHLSRVPSVTGETRCGPPVNIPDITILDFWLVIKVPFAEEYITLLFSSH